MRARAPAVIAVAASLLVLLVLSVLSQGGGRDDLDPSSQSHGKAGSLALYLWLDRLGLPVHRITGSLDLAGTDVLVVYSPTRQIGADETTQLTDFIAAGGDVILAIDPSGSAVAVTPLARRLHLRSAGVAAGGDARPVQPLDAGARVGTVPVESAVTFDASTAAPLLERDGSAVAAGIRNGQGGHLWVIGSTLPLSNDGLRHGSSALFVLSLLERARGGRVGFDEVHHGATDRAGAATILYSPVGLAALLATLVVLAWQASAGRRPGRPVPAEDPAAVPSALTYVDAMAGLFERSRRRGAVADRYADELKVRVGAGAGVDPHIDDVAFVSRLAGYGEGAASEVEAVLQRARSLAAGNPDQAALLALARDVDRVEDSWRAGGTAR